MNTPTRATDHQYSGTEQVPAFTPGPWRYSGVLGGCFVYTSSGVQVLAYKHNPGAENKANARLIAAAPDMYEALKFVLSDPVAHVLGSVTLDEVRAALAKANNTAEK